MAQGWLLWSIVLVMSLLISVQVEGFGVNWGTITTHSLPHKTIIQMLKDNGMSKVKFFDVDPPILKALSGSGFDVMVGLPNGRLADVGTDYSKAQAWVKENVTAYNPTSKDGVNITMVAIGNEPFLIDFKDMFTNDTLPALKNIQKALNEAKLDHIKATVPFNGDVYFSPWDHPVPSAGKFRPDISDKVVAIVKALNESQAPFMVNIYPFLALYQGNGSFPFEYAFFDGGISPLMDGQVAYGNAYDANLDSLVSALKLAGYGGMPIIVGEMGWPTDGDKYANATLASRFNNGLIKKMAEGKGTPLLPKYPEVYLFGLFDEDSKSVAPGKFERHWGIFTYDGQPKYDFDLSGGKKKFAVGAKDVKYLEKVWCVVKEGVTDKKALDEAVTYACDRTDCTALVPGASCSSLDDNGKASFALNGYFQTMNQAKGSCDFGGLAELTSKNVSQGDCNFFIQLADMPAKAPAAAPGSSPGTNADGSPGANADGSPSKHSGSPGRPFQMAMAFSAIIIASTLVLS